MSQLRVLSVSHTYPPETSASGVVRIKELPGNILLRICVIKLPHTPRSISWKVKLFNYPVPEWQFTSLNIIPCTK